MIAPEQSDIDEIESWLKEEYNKCDEGFYCNWNIILEAFNSDQLIILSLASKAIGFVVWGANDIHANIDIFVIDPSFRCMGYGQFFFNALSDFFVEEGFWAVKLFCAPRESERFWQRMGLERLPDCGYSEPELSYYCILIETPLNTNIRHLENKVELWNVEPYQKEYYEPIWTWYVEMINNDLVFPIVQPCNCNWNLRWTRNGEVIRERKVKYFTDQIYDIYFDKFMYISELVEGEDDYI